MKGMRLPRRLRPRGGFWAVAGRGVLWGLLVGSLVQVAMPWVFARTVPSLVGDLGPPLLAWLATGIGVALVDGVRQVRGSVWRTGAANALGVTAGYAIVVGLAGVVALKSAPLPASPGRPHEGLAALAGLVLGMVVAVIFVLFEIVSTFIIVLVSSCITHAALGARREG